MKSLALVLQIKGEVIESNLPDFRKSITDGLQTINRDIRTDEEFGQAELDTKALKDLQGSIVDARNNAMSQAESLNAVLRELDSAADDVRRVRLSLERTVKERKASIKREIVSEYIAYFAERGEVSSARAAAVSRPGLTEAIKGKRTIESMRKACETYATEKLGALEEARGILRAWIDGNDDRKSLLPDEATLELSDPQQLPAELERRLERRRLQEEADKAKRALAEQKAKANAEQAQREEASKPPAKPVTTPPAKKAELTEEDEMKAFKAAFIAAMAPLKTARASLTFEANQKKAAAFANRVNEAFGEEL